MQWRATRPPALLVLGSHEFYQYIRAQLHPVGPLTHLSMSSLECNILDRLAPDFIIAPLFNGNTDCMEISETLHGFGYEGCILFVSENLPNPAMIETEIRQHIPQLNFHVLPVSSLRQLIGEPLH